MRLAAVIPTNVPNTNSRMLQTICHTGMMAPVASRRVIIRGVEGGKKDSVVAKVPLGSRTTIIHTIKGNIITIHTGSSRL